MHVPSPHHLPRRRPPFCRWCSFRSLACTAPLGNARRLAYTAPLESLDPSTKQQSLLVAQQCVCAARAAATIGRPRCACSPPPAWHMHCAGSTVGDATSTAAATGWRRVRAVARRHLPLCLEAVNLDLQERRAHTGGWVRCLRPEKRWRAVPPQTSRTAPLGGTAGCLQVERGRTGNGTAPFTGCSA